MDADPFHIRLDQPSLFEFDNNSIDAVELFPAVWSAAEAIISPDPQVRMQGLEQIAQTQAARFSPLIAYLLFTRFMSHNPKNPKWYARDRFVLSAGHGSMLLYALLHLTGYALGLDEL